LVLFLVRSLFCPCAPPRPPLSPLSLHDALPISLLDLTSLDGVLVEGTKTGLPNPNLEVRSRRVLSTFRSLDTWFWVAKSRGALRSEEHTSELQSRFDLVCRLLLEKKNRYNTIWG